MAKVDEEGEVVGFSILRVSSLTRNPKEVALWRHAGVGLLEGYEDHLRQRG
jgi:hypothetical protein